MPSINKIDVEDYVRIAMTQGLCSKVKNENDMMKVLQYLHETVTKYINSLGHQKHYKVLELINIDSFILEKHLVKKNYQNAIEYAKVNKLIDDVSDDDESDDDESDD